MVIQHNVFNFTPTHKGACYIGRHVVQNAFAPHTLARSLSTSYATALLTWWSYLSRILRGWTCYSLHAFVCKPMCLSVGIRVCLCVHRAGLAHILKPACGVWALEMCSCSRRSDYFETWRAYASPAMEVFWWQQSTKRTRHIIPKQPPSKNLKCNSSCKSLAWMTLHSSRGFLLHYSPNTSLPT